VAKHSRLLNGEGDCRPIFPAIRFALSPLGKNISCGMSKAMFGEGYSHVRNSLAWLVSNVVQQALK